MRTQKDIEYHAAPYGYIATIPKGTGIVPATNLPGAMHYWSRGWRGMSQKAKSWHRTYGFLLEAAEVRA